METRNRKRKNTTKRNDQQKRKCPSRDPLQDITNTHSDQPISLSLSLPSSIPTETFPRSRAPSASSYTTSTSSQSIINDDDVHDTDHVSTNHLLLNKKRVTCYHLQVNWNMPIVC